MSVKTSNIVTIPSFRKIQLYLQFPSVLNGIKHLFVSKINVPIFTVNICLRCNVLLQPCKPSKTTLENQIIDCILLIACLHYSPTGKRIKKNNLQNEGTSRVTMDSGWLFGLIL